MRRFQFVPVGCFLLIGFVCQPVLALLPDGEKDNHPDQVRRIPRLGIKVPDSDRKELEKGLSRLSELIQMIGNGGSDYSKKLLPDVEIFHRAVRDNLDHREFFSAGDVRKAHSLLKIGIARGEHLLKNEAPWLKQTGLVVRGFRSALDDTVQPYGLIIPPGYRFDGEKSYRLDIWFHGRGETLSETNFIDQRMKNPGYYQPRDTIVLHPYGRYSNAFKFAGEIDVLEALDHAQTHYRVDADRISVRGFSMGGAACWQFAFLYSDRWFAANPGAGFSETPEFLKSFQKEKLTPYPWEEKLWRWYDADDHAINFNHVPTIAYSGELDIQKQAADVMERALAREGIRLLHIIGPKSGHRIHPESQLEIERRMGSLARRGNDSLPRVVYKQTHTLRYNRQYWLTITGLEEHWEPGRVRAEIQGNTLQVQTRGVSGIRFDIPPGFAEFKIGQPVTIKVDQQTISGPLMSSDRSWSFEIHFDQQWKPGPAPRTGLAKVHGLQGPIDDALMSRFLFVTPTGKPVHENVGDWTRRELDHAITHWRQQFRGHVRIRKDTALTDQDIAESNLILWGDYRSNRVLARIIDRLPLNWNAKTVSIGQLKFDSRRHVPILVFPNPLNPRKYVVLNSSFTYREYAYLNNARQTPKLPDWAIVDIVSRPSLNDAISRFPGIPVQADFFDEHWQVKLPPTSRETLIQGIVQGGMSVRDQVLKNSSGVLRDMQVFQDGKRNGVVFEYTYAKDVEVDKSQLTAEKIKLQIIPAVQNDANVQAAFQEDIYMIIRYKSDAGITLGEAKLTSRDFRKTKTPDQ